MAPPRLNEYGRNCPRRPNRAISSVIKGGLDEVNINSDEMEVPVLGKIAAGTPVEAIQNEVSRIPLPSNLEKNGDYFGLKVQGDSMIEAGINEINRKPIINGSGPRMFWGQPIAWDDQRSTRHRAKGRCDG